LNSPIQEGPGVRPRILERVPGPGEDALRDLDSAGLREEQGLNHRRRHEGCRLIAAGRSSAAVLDLFAHDRPDEPRDPVVHVLRARAAAFAAWTWQRNSSAAAWPQIRTS